MRALVRGLRPLPVASLLLVACSLGFGLAGWLTADPVLLGFAGVQGVCGLVLALLGGVDAI